MRWCLYLILLLITVGCDVPSAAPEENPTLVIATDRVIESDSILFAEFGEKHRLTIQIKELSVDSLIHLYQEDPYGLGIDVVLIHKAYDMRKVRREQLLEELKEKDFSTEASLSKSKTFVTCGIDPYVVVSKKGVRINVYDDLHTHPFILNLDQKSIAHFFSPYEKRLHRTKTFEHIKSISNNALPMNRWTADSSHAILTTNSEFQRKASEDSLWSDFNNIQFPNSSTSGVFYDVITGGIVQQSSHTQLSNKFLQWITSKGVNRRFTDNRNYHPIFSNGKYRRFATPADILMQYHTMIERMLRETE